MEIGVIIKLNVQVVTDGVFDFGGFCLCAMTALGLFLKILVQDRDGLDLHLDTARFEERVGDIAQLRRNASHAEASVTEMLLGENIYFREPLVLTHEIKRFLGRKDEVQGFREFLEEAYELKAQVLVIEKIEKRVVVREVGEAMRFKEVQDRRVARLEFTQFLFWKTQHLQHFVLFALVVVVEGLLQVVTDADVIDYKPLVLCGTAYPIYAGDSLEKAVRNDNLVEVHHLLYRRIESGE